MQDNTNSRWYLRLRHVSGMCVIPLRHSPVRLSGLLVLSEAVGASTLTRTENERMSRNKSIHKQERTKLLRSWKRSTLKDAEMRKSDQLQEAESWTWTHGLVLLFFSHKNFTVFVKTYYRLVLFTFHITKTRTANNRSSATTVRKTIHQATLVKYIISLSRNTVSFT